MRMRRVLNQPNSSGAHKTFSLIFLCPEYARQKTPSCSFLKVQELPLIAILLSFTFVPTVYENIGSYFVIKMFDLESFISQFLSVTGLFHF